MRDALAHAPASSFRLFTTLGYFFAAATSADFLSITPP
jgi:hypothetical protein